MQGIDQVRYRLRLAEGFLSEASQDIGSQRWRSCIDNAQLAVENAAKVLLALLGPVGRTHNPAALLREVLDSGHYIEAVRPRVERVIECAELLGPDIHIQSDYGDEGGGRTPWELFDESDAQHALRLAEEAVMLAQEIVASQNAGK
jgi:HEPN domain-containing protein